MRRIWPIRCLIALALTFGSAAPVGAGPITMDFTGGMPVKFGRVAIVVDGLGLLDRPSPELRARHQPGLWSSVDQTLPAQTRITIASMPAASTSSFGRWLFDDIVPVVLMRGAYMVGAVFRGLSDIFVTVTDVSTKP